MDLNNRLNQIKIKDIIIIYLFSILIVSIIIFGIVKLNHKDVGNFIISTITLILQLLILLTLFLRIKPSKKNILFLYNDFKKKIKKTEIIEVTFIKLCISIGGSKVILGIFYFIDPIIVNTFIYESASLVNSFGNYFVNMVLLLLVSPIVEEVVFRGIIFNRLINKFNLCTGIVASSMVFASFYAGSGIAGALALGIINCILYIKYKNILITIFVNLINNAIVLISVIPSLNGNFTDIIISYNDVITDILLGIVAFLIGILGMLKYINKNKIVLNKFDKYIKGKKGIY